MYREVEQERANRDWKSAAGVKTATSECLPAGRRRLLGCLRPAGGSLLPPVQFSVLCSAKSAGICLTSLRSQRQHLAAPCRIQPCTSGYRLAVRPQAKLEHTAAVQRYAQEKRNNLHCKYSVPFVLFPIFPTHLAGSPCNTKNNMAVIANSFHEWQIVSLKYFSFLPSSKNLKPRKQCFCDAVRELV